MGGFIDNEVVGAPKHVPPYSHAAGFTYCERIELVACADLRVDVMAEFGKLYNVPTASQYTDYQEMIAQENLDIVSVATHLRLDSRLFDHPPARIKPDGTKRRGRPPGVGERLPNLAQGATFATTCWHRGRVDWYDGESEVIDWATGTALWYSTGTPPIHIRWVLVRDPSGKHETVAYFSTDIHQSAPAIIEDFDLDLPAIEAAITDKARGIIINSPHNPTGKIYTPDTLMALAQILTKASRRNVARSICFRMKPTAASSLTGALFTALPPSIQMRFSSILTAKPCSRPANVSATLPCPRRCPTAKRPASA